MVKNGNRVLDLGCGTGYFTTILSELVGSEGKVVGVDPDAERIKLANENNARVNIVYIIGNDQTFPEDQYDVVFLNHVLPRVECKEKAFQRIYQNLHTEGRFAFLTFDGTPTFPPVIAKAFNELIGPDFLQNLIYNASSKNSNWRAHIMGWQNLLGLKLVTRKRNKVLKSGTA